jgi:hypothetical protein
MFGDALNSLSATMKVSTTRSLTVTTNVPPVCCRSSGPMRQHFRGCTEPAIPAGGARRTSLFCGGRWSVDTSCVANSCFPFRRAHKGRYVVPSPSGRGRTPSGPGSGLNNTHPCRGNRGGGELLFRLHGIHPIPIRRRRRRHECLAALDVQSTRRVAGHRIQRPLKSLDGLLPLLRAVGA